MQPWAWTYLNEHPELVQQADAADTDDGDVDGDSGVNWWRDAFSST